MDQSDDNRVQLLPPDLASQIAAGEVVERPASALKELLENSVDAGATRCTIEIEGGGISRICVLDDGLGMSSSDAERALQRHATSKLRELRDLEALVSYGFRGEALPSIASVSKFTLRTRRECDSEGIELRTQGSLAPSLLPVGCAVGTFIEVRDLFFNVPARRKFLRSTGTESGHLTDVVDHLALARPELALTLRRDGRQSRSFHRASSREERARQHFDLDLLACRGSRGPVALEAYLTPPHQARAGAQGLRLLINNRPIRDRSLAVAAAQAYGHALERGQYPRGVIYLDLPPSLVDFNVHPQKLELRFAEPRAVSDAVYRLLRDALSEQLRVVVPAARSEISPPPSQDRKAPTPKTPTRAARELGPPGPHLASARGGWQLSRSRPSRSSASPSTPWRGTSSSTTSSSSQRQPMAGPDSSSGGPRPSGASPPQPALEQQATLNTIDSVRFLAQTSRGYLVCEAKHGLCLVEPHAATERIALSQLELQLQAGTVERQTLLFPAELSLTESEARHVEQHLADFASIGMSLIRRDTTRFTLHSVPRVLRDLAAARAFQEVLVATMISPDETFSGRMHSVLPQLACQAALPPGKGISPAQAEAMLAELPDANPKAACLHPAAMTPLPSWEELKTH